MTRSVAAFAAASLLATLAGCATIRPATFQAERPAPALDLVQVWGDGPEGDRIHLKDFKGRVVVLEFWATWCGPCVGAIDHLNSLAKKMEDDPVVFVSITDEQPEQVVPFLDKTPIQGVVARLEGGPEARRKLGVTSLPTTVVLGTDGKVLGVTYPHFIQQDHLEKILAGQPVSLPAMPTRPEGPKLGEGPEPLYLAMVRPSAPGDQGMSRSGSGIIEQTNMPIVYLLAHVFGTSPSRLHVEGELPEGNFDLIVRLPKTEDIADLRTRTREQAKAAVLQAFGLTAKQVSRERDVLVLEVPSGKKTKLTATDSSPGMMMCGGGQYKASSATTTNLADCLERMLDEPVVDATGLAGSYSFDLAFSPRGEVEPSEAQVAKALGEQAGLALVKGKREIDVVIVQVAGTPPHPQEGGDR